MKTLKEVMKAVSTPLREKGECPFKVGEMVVFQSHVSKHQAEPVQSFYWDQECYHNGKLGQWRISISGITAPEWRFKKAE